MWEAPFAETALFQPQNNRMCCFLTVTTVFPQTVQLLLIPCICVLEAALKYVKGKHTAVVCFKHAFRNAGKNTSCAEKHKRVTIALHCTFEQRISCPTCHSHLPLAQKPRPEQNSNLFYFSRIPVCLDENYRQRCVPSGNRETIKTGPDFLLDHFPRILSYSKIFLSPLHRSAKFSE